VVLPREQGLHDHVVDARPQEVHIDAYLLEVLAEGPQTPLETEIVLFCILILNKVLVLLVDRVVRQVHILVVLVDF
jgi:hypothetical protein